MSEERNQAVQQRPDVQAWINKFRQLCKEMPADIGVILASDVLKIVVLDTDGEFEVWPDGSLKMDGISTLRSCGAWAVW